MKNFADRLMEAIRLKGNPCVVGLDPRIDDMPDFVTSHLKKGNWPSPDEICNCIVDFHRGILDVIASHVPAIKAQIAFYEQYGIGGIKAFEETINIAKTLGLLVIVDAKRNDISSTAEAYANEFLGRTTVLGVERPIYDVDCITVSPYLGEDSLIPFIDVCRRYKKGIFVLVKTSNPGSKDLQDLRITDKSSYLYMKVAEIVKRQAQTLIGDSGYSSIGAVVGATFPEEAERLRAAMPRSIFLVPGYGAQGGTAEGAARCFNQDGLGAIVNASRSITYAFKSKSVTKIEYQNTVHSAVQKMIEDIDKAIKAKRIYR